MCLVYRWLLSSLVALFLFGMPQACLAGIITYGGDLLQGLSQTPLLLAGGQMVDTPFSASVPNLGVLSGDVQLENVAGTAGAIRLVNFQFQSLRPAGTGDVSFTLLVDQNFAYAGPPTVKGTFSLSGSTTFTASPQSSSGFVAGFLGVVLDPLPFSFTAGPQGSFPQKQEFGMVGSLPALTAEETMRIQLSVSLRLSDNALSPGPRFDGAGNGGEFASLSYAASPVPEPATEVLLGLGVLSVLGYAWRRQVR
jgi:hypothetical protein